MAEPRDEGPSTGTRGQDLRQKPGADLEDKARSTALRDEATFERGSGAVRPEQRDPSVQGTSRETSVDATALAAFAQDLLATSEMGEMDGGMDVTEEGEEFEIVEESPLQERRVKKPHAARKPKMAHGGVDDSGTDDPSDDAPAPEPVSRSRKWPRVSARKRIRLLDLHALIAFGEEQGMLGGWQVAVIEPRIVALNARAYHYLRTAHDALETRSQRVVLLQAVAAHRRPEDFEALAEALDGVTSDALAAWTAEREEARPIAEREAPGECPDADTLQRHYDPCHRWLGEPTHSPVASEEWGVPQWLRRARREALELAALAFLQAGRGILAAPDLDDMEEVPEGASDPLAAAVELHGEAHPAIARWGVTLLARADDAAGLDSAAVALMRARETLGG